MWHIFWKIFIAFCVYCNHAEAQGTSCKWDVMHCDKSEVSCSDSESVLLDSKNPLNAEHCFALKDNDNGDFYMHNQQHSPIFNGDKISMGRLSPSVGSFVYYITLQYSLEL